ncbi:DUF6503 family protein [Flavobacterium sp. PL002]|uniref:DUF6503 family protein n=1 Tax=Flavobacterium sp. PL002 TaxID=1897058 RepID=UPI0019DCBEC6|nr:DUF6503 family protein [Flavobacterium sp. PL002]MBE0390615.1 hypothetical protein [Flavobacterium sp. PL002]
MANYNTNLRFSALIKSLFVLCFLVFFKASAQEITGEQLLDKAINYHDPDHHYNDFKSTLSIAMKMPDDTERLSKVSIDLPKQYFKLNVTKNDKEVTYIIDKEVVNFSLDGKSDFTEEDVKTFNLTETRARFMQNYYTYLYGLPMKLKDAGTIINPVVERKDFMGQEYLVLAVKYEEGVGKDAWYFYFDTKTYALKVYQFYHDQKKNDGEYILLSGEEELSGIKIPKARAWYLNQDDKYLATDTLSKS